MPPGINFIAVGAGYSDGNLLLDPGLPIEGVEGEQTFGFIRYTRTMALLQKSAKLKILLPYTSGDWAGTVDGIPASRSADGFGDIRLTLEWNLYGAPALSSSDFADFQQDVIVGASVRLIVPTGEYDNTKIINLGSNRWTVRAEVGASKAFGNWLLEAAGDVWVFGKNDDFVAGLELEQDPLYVLKLMGLYTVRPGFWFGLGVGYGNGGRTIVEGFPRDTRQENLRLLAAMAYPFTPNQGVSVGYAIGRAHGAGAEFDAITVAYQFAWGAD